MFLFDTYPEIKASNRASNISTLYTCNKYKIMLFITSWCSSFISQGKTDNVKNFVTPRIYETDYRMTEPEKSVICNHIL